jgi:hypothetical protein
MITQKIVLVLGAGASIPFGFPSGATLKTNIISSLVPPHRMRSHLMELGFEPPQIEDFRVTLSKSGKASVDAFLEHRADFLDVGKAATACALLPCETAVEESLFHGRDNWYEYFFNKLNARFEDFSRNSVAVLTFNYDRSLEHYLFTALTNSYRKTAKECAQVVRSIPIVHLYGQLGELPQLAKDGTGVAFGAPMSVDTWSKAANGIKIIHEAVTDEQPFKQAQDLLRNARRVCFLGFGYNQTNLQRLMGYGPILGGPEIFGSALGFTERECSFIRSQLQGLGFGRVLSLNESYGEAFRFLHYHCPFD